MLKGICLHGCSWVNSLLLTRNMFEACKKMNFFYKKKKKKCNENMLVILDYADKTVSLFLF